MAARAMTVAAAVHRVQLALLDGAAASNEPLLHAATALLSRADYDDVVTERSIADACGSPVCTNPLPEAADPKAAAPRFHISLREHRVYDLEEARKFCSERCLVASAAFAASLPPDSPFGVPPERLDALVALFEGRVDGPGLGFAGGGGKDDDGRKVEIREKESPGPGEVTPQEWIGPSNAIEGYVPRHDRIGEGPKPEAKQNKVSIAEQSQNKIVDSRNAAPGEDGMAISSSSVETRVSSEVIAKELDDMVLSENTKTKKKEATKTPLKMLKQDEDNDMLSSCISDSIAKQLEDVVLEEKNDRKKKKATKASSRACKSKLAKTPAGSDGHEVDFTSTIFIGDHSSAKMDQRTVGRYNFSSSILAGKHPSSSQYASRDSSQAYTEQLHEEFSKVLNIGKDVTSDEKVKHALKSSLKATGSKNRSQSVTWADENGSVLETSKGSVLETSKAYESHSNGKKQSVKDIDSSLRCASAEACAAALTEVTEAISSGTLEVEDAVSKAGIIILPDMLHQKQFEDDYDNDKDTLEKDIFETDSGVVKWPKKTVLLDTDMFEVDDSWHDTPTEGFGLTLSTFATMWAALFGWISRSSLAYMYGLDESSVQELLIANGREYPQKIILKDGQSSEIRRALDTCVCNALPVLVSSLRMKIPVSKLEITLGHLIDTMSFVDALPSLRSRQWQVMVLMLLNALSVHQLPALASSDVRFEVSAKAQVSREEYDSMIDLFLPFGRSVQTTPPS